MLAFLMALCSHTQVDWPQCSALVSPGVSQHCSIFYGLATCTYTLGFSRHWLYGSLWVGLFTAHVGYLSLVKFDYGYNMAASVGAGESTDCKRFQYGNSTFSVTMVLVPVLYVWNMYSIIIVAYTSLKIHVNEHCCFVCLCRCHICCCVGFMVPKGRPLACAEGQLLQMKFPYLFARTEMREDMSGSV